MNLTADYQLSSKIGAQRVGLFALPLFFVFIGLARNVEAQSVAAFYNLNFEQALIQYDPNTPYPGYGVYASNAIPGWAAYINGSAQTDIIYNTTSLGAAEISLFGPGSGQPILGGKYSLELYGGAVGAPASIVQTGLVPPTANSIIFKAFAFSPGHGSLLMSLGGQNISYRAISSEANYTIYGGDVASLAGQMSQLAISAPMGDGNNYWVIDDISFSASPVPEPQSIFLLIAGCVTMGIAGRLRARAKRSRGSKGLIGASEPHSFF